MISPVQYTSSFLPVICISQFYGKKIFNYMLYINVRKKPNHLFYCIFCHTYCDSFLFGGHFYSHVRLSILYIILKKNKRKLILYIILRLFFFRFWIKLCQIVSENSIVQRFLGFRFK